MTPSRNGSDSDLLLGLLNRFLETVCGCRMLIVPYAHRYSFKYFLVIFCLVQCGRLIWSVSERTLRTRTTRLMASSYTRTVQRTAPINRRRRIKTNATSRFMLTVSCRGRYPFSTTDWRIRHLRRAFTTPDSNADERNQEMPTIKYSDVGVPRYS